jgi:replication factor C subunit 1
MPSDIRNFFGGKVAAPIREKEPKKEDDSKKKRTSKKSWASRQPWMLIYLEGRKVIDDSDDDEPTPA